MRTFISINTDDSVKEIIAGIQKKLKKSISLLNEDFLKSIRWEDKDKFHLTLFFIGDVNESRLNEINFLMSKKESELSLTGIKFELKGINAFPKLRYPRVLILELMNEDKKVFELSQRINESLKEIGFINDKIFKPHITLGRVKREHKINLTGLDCSINHGITFSANEFFLMESKLMSSGSEYTVIKKYMI